MIRRTSPSRLLALGLLACLNWPAFGAPAAPVKGQRYTIGEGDHTITVLKLWGTPYQMGYAHGTLCADEIKGFVKRIILAMCLGMNTDEAQLDAAWAQMAPFVPERYLQELKGLSDGSGVPLVDIQRAHAIPDLSEFHCTFFAAWGSATADHHLHQIRALDYAMAAGLQNCPALIVSRPAGGQRFVNVGWLGFIGVVSGMNDRHLALSEIGDHFGDEHETLAGEPMPFLMRQVLEEAGDLATAIRLFSQAKRTSSFLYCVSDAKIPTARKLRTCHDFCQVFGPEPAPLGGLKDVVFWSMGCNSRWNAKVRDVLAPRLGRINETTGMQDVMHGLRTGNLHAVHYDVTALRLWVANASPVPHLKPAYDRPFVAYEL